MTCQISLQRLTSKYIKMSYKKKELASFTVASLKQRESIRTRYYSSIYDNSTTHWSQYEMAPPDTIIGLNEAFAKNKSHLKVNVGVGAYRGDDGLPFVLDCVRKAEYQIMNGNNSHEYLNITGDPDFVNLALTFVYGDNSEPLRENRVAAVQTVSGTGGLRVFGELLRKGGHSCIYVPDPSWGNHIPIFRNSGLEVRKYRYYDNLKSIIDFDNLIKDIKEIPVSSAILFHACAHNPTGMDPTPDQWAKISQIVKKRNLLPFFDCAYQGFASGNAGLDAYAIRMFVKDGHNMATVQSFSKNFGLYGQRVGALSLIASNEDEAQKLLSQLKLIIRPMYSNPPKYGSQIVKTILADKYLTDLFINECKVMADRINSMRIRLRSLLEKGEKNSSWEHITKQVGMFAYSGLTEKEVTELRNKYHIYCTLDGRISMAGVTSGNVNYIAHAINDVIVY